MTELENLLASFINLDQIELMNLLETAKRKSAEIPSEIDAIEQEIGESERSLRFKRSEMEFLHISESVLRVALGKRIEADKDSLNISSIKSDSLREHIIDNKSLYYSPINDLELSCRLIRTLQRHGIETIFDVIRLRRTIRSLPGMGIKKFRELNNILKEKGVNLWPKCL